MKREIIGRIVCRLSNVASNSHRVVRYVSFQNLCCPPEDVICPFNFDKSICGIVNFLVCRRAIIREKIIGPYVPLDDRSD